MEAQEVGEAFDLTDRLLYALDGLRAGCGGGGGGGSPAAAAAAAAEVADVLASRRGRLALRAGGMFGEVMDAGAAAVEVAVRRALGAAAAGGGDDAAAAAVAASAAVALPLAAGYLALAADPACRAALAVPAAARLATALLTCHADAETGASVSDGTGPPPPSTPPLPPSSPAARALRLLRGGVLARAVPAHASACPSSVVMAAIAHTTDPAAVESAAAAAGGGGGNGAAVAADAVKAALGGAGAVAALAFAAAIRGAQAAALPPSALEEYGGPMPTGGGAAGAAAAAATAPLSPPSAAAHAGAVRAARVLWPLHAALTCVEQLTFAAADNEARALAATVPVGGWCAGGGGGGGGSGAPPTSLPFPAWLVRAVPVLGGHPGTPGAPARPSRAASACERVTLAVLMNITQAGGPGCGPVVRAGGVAAAGRALVAALPPEAAGGRTGSPPSSPAADRAADLASSRRLSVALGLLINLADGGGGPACAALAGLDGGAAVRALGRLVGAAALAVAPPPPPAARRGHPAAGVPAPADAASQPTTKSGDGEDGGAGGGPGATEASLEAADDEGEASILEAYASVLLAFLLEGAPPPARPAVLGAIPPAVGLGGVAASVAQCLRFYSVAGAITPHAQASLQRVLKSIMADLPGVVTATAGAM